LRRRLDLRRRDRRARPAQRYARTERLRRAARRRRPLTVSTSARPRWRATPCGAERMLRAAFISAGLPWCRHRSRDPAWPATEYAGMHAGLALGMHVFACPPALRSGHANRCVRRPAVARECTCLPGRGFDAPLAFAMAEA